MCSRRRRRRRLLHRPELAVIHRAHERLRVTGVRRLHALALQLHKARLSCAGTPSSFTRDIIEFIAPKPRDKRAPSSCAHGQIGLRAGAPAMRRTSSSGSSMDSSSLLMYRWESDQCLRTSGLVTPHVALCRKCKRLQTCSACEVYFATAARQQAPHAQLPAVAARLLTTGVGPG